MGLVRILGGRVHKEAEQTDWVFVSKLDFWVVLRSEDKVKCYNNESCFRGVCETE